jgi:hypothetical protein
MLHTPARPAIDPRWFAAYTARANGPVIGSQLSASAQSIRPGDFLPPQPCLAASAWADSGFRVGPLPRDVCADLPAGPGRVLLFGPLGVLSSLAPEDSVTVVRPNPA